MTKPVLRLGWGVKGNRARRSHKRRALCPPLPGTRWWPSKRRHAMSKSEREGACGHSLFCIIPVDRRGSSTMQLDDPYKYTAVELSLPKCGLGPNV